MIMLHCSVSCIYRVRFKIAVLTLVTGILSTYLHNYVCELCITMAVKRWAVEVLMFTSFKAVRASSYMHGTVQYCFFQRVSKLSWNIMLEN